jgi:hypothetical protein
VYALLLLPGKIVDTYDDNIAPFEWYIVGMMPSYLVT